MPETTPDLPDVKALSLRLPNDVYEAVKAVSTANGESMNALIVQALRTWLAEPIRQAELRARIQDVTERYSAAIDKLAHL